MKKINRKFQIFTLLAISILLIPSVSACRHSRNVEKSARAHALGIIPASAVSTPTGTVDPQWQKEFGDYLVVYYGSSATFKVTLTIDGANYFGDSNTGPRTEFQYLKTNTLLTISPRAVWTFSEGTFEGKIIMSINNYPGTGPTSWHVTLISCILYGTKGFQGQKLVLSYNGPMVGAAWTGYIIER